ncbi:MAG: 5'-methylthioadenosine/adenosylhomocysteine nucleosidase [Alphaproteobacteria bacterium]|nr:5'-methylthioadenosine/adenosylhomocysteine nucleosidase [Alphaproteobacteria bacterium]
MTIGIIVAMQSEFDLVLKTLAGAEIKKIRHLTFATGKINNQDVVLLQSGIGKVSAALATVELINLFAPKMIINTGLAGGLDPSLSVMDIVVGKDIVYHDVWCGEENEYGQVQGLPAIFHSDEKLVAKALAIRSDTKIVGGLIASGDRFLSKLADLKEVKSHFENALAVDMESAAIAQVCYLYGIEFLSMRIISDTPGIENHYDQYYDFWKKAPEKTLEVIEALLR